MLREIFRTEKSYLRDLQHLRAARDSLGTSSELSSLLGNLPSLEKLSVCSHGAEGRPAGRLRAGAALATGMLVSGCRDGELQLWSTSRLLSRTQAHAAALRAISVAPDGRRFASGGDDGAVLVWDGQRL